jgi:hypothetical protein
VESDEKLETLQALPLDKQPRQCQAAFALRAALASSISPAQDDLANHPVELAPTALGHPKTFTAVLIEVGKKP